MQCDIVHCDFNGTFYVPRPPMGARIIGGILVLHGGEGCTACQDQNRVVLEPWHCRMAKFFAQNGFAALALNSWGGYGTPQEQIDIDLMPSFKALALLKERFGKVGVHGASRGAEQALLLGAIACGDHGVVMPDAIAIHAATDTVKPAWANGQPVRGRCHWRWDRYPYIVETGEKIPAERYPGPLFISHGERDDVWSIEGARKIARVRSRYQDLITETLLLPGEAHVFSAAGEVLRRRKTLEFFQRHLVA